MGLMEELSVLDATAQSELVKRKEVKPVELVEAAIERIERLNPTINAVVTQMYDQAREIASSPVSDGPFMGVPLLLKDLLASYAGVPTTSGSAFLKDFVPSHDSELVSRLKKAGLIIIGKTNTPEYGTLPTTEPRLFGPCKNPWDTTRTTGGSSGGSAAAVAAGMVPMAHGNDGGGSIRIPASCCGVFGLKPTRARNPLGPDFGDIMGGLVAEHAITRSVRDSARLLDATSGPGIGDPYWAPLPSRPFADEVGADPGRLRIAFTTVAPTGSPVHPDSVSAVYDAAGLCAVLGHFVEEASPTIDAGMFSHAFVLVFTAGHAAHINGLARIIGRTPKEEFFEPLNWTLYEIGRQHTASEYLLAQTAFHRITRDIGNFFTKYDVFLTPTLAESPVPLGTFDSPNDTPLHGMFRSMRFMPFTPLANVTGQPAMSVPLYWSKDGLPIGSHFMGRFGDEATLFRLAAQLEAARPWANRRPPVSAV